MATTTTTSNAIQTTQSKTPSSMLTSWLRPDQVHHDIPDIARRELAAHRRHQRMGYALPDLLIHIALWHVLRERRRERQADGQLIGIKPGSLVAVALRTI